MKLKYLTFLSLSLALGITLTTAGDRSFGEALPEFLRRFDTNEDGKIDEEERQAIRDAREARHNDWIAQWDSNGNGELSQAEIEAARETIRAKIEERRKEHFAEIAGDDGCLDHDEFAGLPLISFLDDERIAAIFDRLDTDDDDCVTLEEFTARLRHHRKPAPLFPPLPIPPDFPGFPISR